MLRRSKRTGTRGTSRRTTRRGSGTGSRPPPLPSRGRNENWSAAVLGIPPEAPNEEVPAPDTEDVTMGTEDDGTEEEGTEDNTGEDDTGEDDTGEETGEDDAVEETATEGSTGGRDEDTADSNAGGGPEDAVIIDSSGDENNVRMSAPTGRPTARPTSIRNNRRVPGVTFADNPYRLGPPYSVYQGIIACGNSDIAIAKRLAKNLFMDDFVRASKTSNDYVKSVFKTLERQSASKKIDIEPCVKNMIHAYHYWIKVQNWKNANILQMQFPNFQLTR